MLFSAAIMNPIRLCLLWSAFLASWEGGQARAEENADAGLTFHAAPSPLAAGAVVAEWPRFLGPGDDCHSVEKPLHKAFSETGPPLVWERTKGNGHPAPVIVGEHLVFIHERDGRETVECLHPETGRHLWTVDYPVTIGQSYGIADAPRSSPVIDAASGLVFTLGVRSDLLAISLDTGKIVWQKNLLRELGDSPFFFGCGSCPLVQGGLLVVNIGSHGACVVAFDVKTGDLRWKSAHEWNGSYASPIAATLHGRPRILVFAGGMTDPPTGGLICLNPATGRIDSSIPWRTGMFASVLAASPVPAGQDRVFVTEDYGKGGLMVRYDEAFQATPAWEAPRFGCQMQTPVFHEGHVYGLAGSAGDLVCYEAATGRLLWSEGFQGLTATWQGKEIRVNLGRGSLMAVDGAFLCLGESGTLLWLDLSPGGAKILAKAQLFYAPETWALPALRHGLLYVNQNTQGARILCYDLRGQ